MDTLILMEPDDDLADCVADFFGHHYRVARLASLDEVRTEMKCEDAAILFVNVDAVSENHVSILEDLHQANPQTRIVATYLSLPVKEAWVRRVRNVADILVRKPYGVVDIDAAIRLLNDADNVSPEGTQEEYR